MAAGPGVAEANISHSVIHPIVVLNGQRWEFIVVRVVGDAQDFGVVVRTGWHFARAEKDLKANICEGQFVTGE